MGCTGRFALGLSHQRGRWSVWCRLLQAPDQLVWGRTGEALPTGPLSSGESLLQPHPSGTLSTADKSFKVPLLCWVLVGPVGCACPPQAAGVPASRGAPALPGVQRSWSPKPAVVRTGVPIAGLQGQVSRTPEHFPLPALFLSFPLVGWGGRRAWVLLSRGPAALPRGVVFSSSPGIGGPFCSLQIVFRGSCICSSCFLCVYVGGGLALPSYPAIFFPRSLKSYFRLLTNHFDILFIPSSLQL